ncbi:hypothetical protein BC829DRAFT_155247 [Chytridium lagenaria]|nr:hypothetical protein BC829DRAFT_155247 [Chytridium lagenaria]
MFKPLFSPPRFCEFFPTCVFFWGGFSYRTRCSHTYIQNQVKANILMASIIQYFVEGNEKFYAKDEIKQTESYFASHTQGLKVEVKYSGEPRGKGLFAKDDGFQPGEVILMEKGLLTMQSLSNKGVSKVCSQCLHFVGGLQMQVEHLLQRSLSEGDVKKLEKIWNKAKNIHPAFKAEVPCGGNCPEVYCSEECKKLDYDHGHDFLCMNSLNPHMLDFIGHCKHTNEAFYLVAKLYARIAADVRRNGKSLKEALLPFRLFVKDVWWNVCEPNEEEDPEDFKVILTTLVEDTTQVFQWLFSEVNEIKEILTFDFLALMLGLFERNNVSIVTPSPILAIFGDISGELSEQIIERLKAISLLERYGIGGDEDSDTEPMEDYEDFNPLSPFETLIAEGTGLHTLQASINHSCNPNAIVFKDDSHLARKSGEESSPIKPVYDGRSVVKAIRRIEPGEEILVSYLDDNLNHGKEEEEEEKEKDKRYEAGELKWRARSLREYGISACSCSKCTPSASSSI